MFQRLEIKLNVFLKKIQSFVEYFYILAVILFYLYYKFFFGYFIYFFNSYFFFFFFFFGLLMGLNIIYNFLLINYLGYLGVFVLNWVTLFFFWSNLIFFYFYTGFENIYLKVNLGYWFKINLNFINYMEFFFNNLTLSYTLLTSTIALSVLLYTFIYFRYEPLLDRLILLISAFVSSMILFVNSGNFIMLFLGWELIGLTSFLLINFWNTRMSTLKSAFKAFIFNKFSDISLLLGILLIYNEFYTIEINIFCETLQFYFVHYYNFWNYSISVIELISFLILISAFIKSAQLGFHVWLPDSMEAPVPASALIHSATLVSAGIFLIFRLNKLFEMSYYSYFILQLWGSSTAFYGGICAIFQSDIKRLLAYSTISHCGFLMICLTLNIYEFTLLYLYIHGFFKASSFLCVGNIIRISLNYQDFRRMGMFYKFLPFEYFILVLSLLNLSGLPFSLGFYSKHIFLTGLLNWNYYYWINFFNCFFGALCGLIYCYRLLYNIFFDFKKNKKIVYKHLNSSLFFSSYYSNTTLLSNMAISLLVFNAYFITYYLFFWYLNFWTICQSLYENFYFNIQFFDLFIVNLNFLINIRVFNYMVVGLIIFLINFKYKYFYFYYNFIYSILFFSFSILLYPLFCFINIFKCEVI